MEFHAAISAEVSHGAAKMRVGRETSAGFRVQTASVGCVASEKNVTGC